MTWTSPRTLVSPDAHPYQDRVLLPAWWTLTSGSARNLAYHVVRSVASRRAAGGTGVKVPLPTELAAHAHLPWHALVPGVTHVTLLAEACAEFLHLRRWRIQRPAELVLPRVPEHGHFQIAACWRLAAFWICVTGETLLRCPVREADNAAATAERDCGKETPSKH